MKQARRRFSKKPKTQDVSVFPGTRGMAWPTLEIQAALDFDWSHVIEAIQDEIDTSILESLKQENQKMKHTVKGKADKL